MIGLRRVALATLATAALAGAGGAAMYEGRNVDGRWYEGRCVSTTYGAYDCQAKFDGDRVLMKLPAAGIQIVGFLDDEVIQDPHDILVSDPRRGVNWTLSLHNLTR